MLRTTLIRSLCSIFVLVLVLVCGTLPAQTAKPLTAHVNHSPNVTPMQAPAAPLKVIFSNLGPTPTNAYDDTNGFFVSGSTGSFGHSQWVAVPFIPKVNATVTQIRVAVGYYFYGTKQIIVGLYSDNSDTVGTALATATATSIPDFGTCCRLVTVNIAPTVLTAGTQYWVAITSDEANAPDFTGIWAQSNLAKGATNASNGGWYTFTDTWSAFAVGGTIP